MTAQINIRNEEIEQVSVLCIWNVLLEGTRGCSQEVNYTISSAKQALNRKKILLCGSLDTKLRKRMMKCFVLSVLLYGVKTWTARNAEKSRLQGFEM